MNLTYAIADLHGADDLFRSALDAVPRHASALPPGRRTIVFLGDYIDRGPGSRQIIERLMAGPPEGWVWVCLKGNHEGMMIETLRAPLDPGWWFGNGGDATLRSYDHPRQGRAKPDDVPAAHLDWMEALPPLAIDRHRVYVHAGIDPALALAQQAEHDLLWSRESNARGHDGRFVVHGHTPHRDGPVTDGRSINLDTFAWHSGRLVIGVFDDTRAGGPIDLVEVSRSTRIHRS